MAFVTSDRDVQMDRDQATGTRATLSDMIVSAAICVALPILFWIAALALGLAAFGISLSPVVATLSIAAMASILIPVWAGVVGLKLRRRKP